MRCSEPAAQSSRRFPGTTRDLITETADIGGLRLELIDTAGMRDTVDEVEVEGVSRARRAWTTADLVLVVLDLSQSLENADFDVLSETASAPRLIAASKSDLPAVWSGADFSMLSKGSLRRPAKDWTVCSVEIRAALEGANPSTQHDSAAVTNVRHAALLERARQSLRRASDAVEDPAGACRRRNLC